MKMLEKCKEGGAVHIMNVMSTTSEWLVSVMMDKDRDTTDFVAKQLVDSVWELVVRKVEDSTKTEALENLSEQMVRLNDFCTTDESYFSNVKALAIAINEETVELVQSEFMEIS